MRSARVLVVLAACILLGGGRVAAQEQVVVNVNTPLADVSRRGIGVNVNYLLDDDANRAAALQTLAQALKAAGAKYLRYPGGEKSDGYLWSVAPYTSSVPTLARWAPGEWPQNQEWPSYDRSLVHADGQTFKTDPLSFDEFMQLCRAIDCVPTIVVCYDSMYKPAQPGGFAPSRELLLEVAREWVRYANVTKGYNVKYWEIGNESWMAHFNGGATATDYANDLVEFSQVMKAIDPTINIGANGGYAEWWQAVLQVAAPSIDFLSVHSYPSHGWNSYAQYRDSAVDLMGNVREAQQAIDTYAPPAHRARLKIAVTEASSANWSGVWPDNNDAARGVILHDIFGEHLQDPRVAFTQLWNTRWSGNDVATTPRIWDALDSRNQLQATGRALGIWGQFLKDQMVATTSTNPIKAYASYAPWSGKVSVFLINKDTIARNVTTTLSGAADTLNGRRWVFRGTGPDDVNPSWSDMGAISTSTGQISVELDPVSVTVLDFTPAIARASGYDGDAQADLAVWRPGSGVWYLLGSQSGYDYGSSRAVQWGSSALDDVPVPAADYDGDRQLDIAVWRPGSGQWSILLSSANYATSAAVVVHWGSGAPQYDDVPVPADYDGDGRADIAVWRRTTGEWYIRRSSDAGVLVVNWGLGTSPYSDRPVPADYDGDGRTDIAVWRPGSGMWYILPSWSGYAQGTAIAVHWGSGAAPYNDHPVQADYDGDGRTDIAVWRPDSGMWFVRSLDGSRQFAVGWGSGISPHYDLPVPADYDGDGLADMAIWRQETGTWWVLPAAHEYKSGFAWSRQWGAGAPPLGDRPVVR